MIRLTDLSGINFVLGHFSDKLFSGMLASDKGIYEFRSDSTRFAQGPGSAPVLTMRTTIMEDGDVHLCFGNPAGNLFSQSMDEIFPSPDYQDRLNAYRVCTGCWTTCYTQRYLLMHPRSIRELLQNISKVNNTKN